MVLMVSSDLKTYESMNKVTSPYSSEPKPQGKDTGIVPGRKPDCGNLQLEFIYERMLICISTEDVPLIKTPSDANKTQSL